MEYFNRESSRSYGICYRNEDVSIPQSESSARIPPKYRTENQMSSSSQCTTDSTQHLFHSETKNFLETVVRRQPREKLDVRSEISRLLHEESPAAKIICSNKRPECTVGVLDQCGGASFTRQKEDRNRKGANSLRISEKSQCQKHISRYQKLISHARQHQQVLLEDSCEKAQSNDEDQKENTQSEGHLHTPEELMKTIMLGRAEELKEFRKVDKASNRRLEAQQRLQEKRALEERVENSTQGSEHSMQELEEFYDRIQQIYEKVLNHPNARPNPVIPFTLQRDSHLNNKEKLTKPALCFKSQLELHYRQLERVETYWKDLERKTRSKGHNHTDPVSTTTASLDISTAIAERRLLAQIAHRRTVIEDVS